jgi:hypothetical protein
MRKLAVAASILFLFFVGSHLFYWSDIGLLSDETCLKIVSSDVLGNPVYGPSCPRTSYSEDVEYRHASGKFGAAIFRFRALPGKGIQCPSISVTVDRRSGEAWVEQ